MTREIKFELAIKNKENGNIWKPILTLDELLDRNGCLYSPGIHEILYKREYTGLKDKNGKEIYEGDILKAGGYVFSDSPYAEYARVPEGELFIVKCLPSGFTAVHSKHNSGIPNLHTNINNYRLWNTQRGFEVIGNIYENAGLLEAASSPESNA